ncbi:hypothetical protein DUI87_20199 [Hirundo rustica rustica]|uniref:Uncharacterized protein n=1 Tax=Hirundo rustica rustica TaxID=333673 RepID=A0A3M0JPV4_HIRRU|nr:hypothetical protein DUI87_20199 [Hirundo rustica rustica]
MDQALLHGAKQYDKRQCEEIDAQEVPPEHEEELYCASDQNEEQTVQRGMWTLHHWSYPRTTWTQSCAMCFGMTLLEQMIYSVILTHSVIP